MIGISKNLQKTDGMTRSGDQKTGSDMLGMDGIFRERKRGSIPRQFYVLATQQNNTRGQAMY